MRRLAPLLLLGGCLSAPTGLDPDAATAIDAGPDAEPAHVWPPDGDIDFQAIAAGDLSGDAAEDLIAVNVGDTNTGVFLLVSGVDVDPGMAALATSYTEYERIDMLDPPVAALVVDDYVVVLDNPTSGGPITILKTDGLDELTRFETGGPQAPSSARVSLKLLGFGPEGGTIAILDGDDVRLLGQEALDEATPTLISVPPPGSPASWATVQTLDSYLDPDPTFLAGLGTSAYSSPVPMGGGQVWTSERGAALWTAQTSGSIPFDGVDDAQVDLIGFDPAAGGNGRICALDMIADSAPTCLATPITEDSGLVLLYGDVAPGPEDDLVVALPGPISTRLDVFPKLRATAGAVAADTSPVVQSFVGTNAHVTTADLDTATGPRMIVQLAEDGDLTCVTVRPEGIERCSD